MPKKPKNQREWQAERGSRWEPIEANPDSLGAAEHVPSPAEEAVRHLLDHPVERIALLGTFGEGVFMTVFVDGLTLREAEEKLGKSRQTVHREAVRLKTVLRKFIDGKEAEDLSGGV